METFDDENKYLKAKHRVAQIKKFYTSLISYVIFISALAALNYYLNEWRSPWFLWAALGWGIGLFFQGTKAFGFSFFGKGWEQRKLKKYLEDEEKSKQNF